MSRFASNLLLKAVISLAPSLPAQAQQSGKLYRLAFVSPASPLEALTATGLPYDPGPPG